ncbi:hypothetical protein [Legionella gresilensis]|uniref:hypothetical protein n=1 Tax=Legionella gresilensis TaxID=91823 RepID=UPI0010417C0F|nr:hypothetical protein [Legionella gresilensis]
MSLVEQKVSKTLEDLENYLNKNARLHVGRDDADKVRKKIGQIIADGFKELSEEDQKSVYKKLSLRLYPDKIAVNQKLLPLLNANNISINEPFLILDKAYKKPNILDIDDLANDPLYTTIKLAVNILEQAYHHLKLYQRYYEPLRTIVNIASWIINIGLVIAGFIAIELTATISTIISFTNTIQNTLMNIITSGALNKATKDLINKPKLYQETEDKFYKDQQALQISILKGKIIFTNDTAEQETIYAELVRIKNMSLEDFKQYYLATQTNEPENIKEKIKEKISQEQLTGFNRIKFTAQFFQHTIFGPLPTGLGNKLVSVMIQRPITALLAPVFIITTAAIELAKKLNALLLLTSLAALTALKFVTLMAVNLPLYLLDTARYVGHKLANLRSHKSKATPDVPTASNEENFDSSYNAMFDNSKPTQTDRDDTLGIDPFTHSKRGLSLFDENKRISNDNPDSYRPTTGSYQS